MTISAPLHASLHSSSSLRDLMHFSSMTPWLTAATPYSAAALVYLPTNPTPFETAATAPPTTRHPQNFADTPCTDGDFEVPRLGCWPSSPSTRLFAPPPATLRTESTRARTSHSTHHTPNLSRTFILTPSTTRSTETATAPQSAPSDGTGLRQDEVEHMGEIPGLWVVVALSVIVFLGWMCWEIWRDIAEMIWRKRYLEDEPLLRDRRMRREDSEAGDVRRR